MIYNYKSKYTGRALRADSWVPPAREDLTSPEARARQERRRRKERERSSWATQRRKANDATRAETRAQRLRVGFDGLLEAAMPPFRPFEALDNLGHPGETLFRAKDGPFAALPRIARELERAKARQSPTGTISCKPRRALSLQKLKRPRTTRDLDMDRVEHLLQTTFAQQISGTRVGSGEEQSTHDSKNRPHTSIRNKRKERIKPRPNTAFSGLFPSDLTTAPNNTNAEVKASDDAPTMEEKKAPSSRPRDGFLLDTREQKKFVMCARQGMLSEMKALFRNHGYSGSVNVNALCENGDAPMHAAAASSQVEVLEYLILMKADPKIPNIDGLLPWDILHRSQSAKRTHKFHHRFRRARAMLDEESTFFRAAKLGNLERILWLCECGHATLQDRNAYGMTVLHLAAMACQRRLVSELLELGLDPNATNNIGQTPLDLVPRGKEGRHVRKLLSSIDDEAEQHQGESTPQGDTSLDKTAYF